MLQKTYHQYSLRWARFKFDRNLTDVFSCKLVINYIIFSVLGLKPYKLLRVAENVPAERDCAKIQFDRNLTAKFSSYVWVLNYTTLYVLGLHQTYKELCVTENVPAARDWPGGDARQLPVVSGSGLCSGSQGPLLPM